MSRRFCFLLYTDFVAKLLTFVTFNLVGTCCWALSTSTTKRQKVQESCPSAYQQQLNKPWRHSPRKESVWDIRHSKSTSFSIHHGDDCRLDLRKKAKESLHHVLGKGLLWALYKDESEYTGCEWLVESTMLEDECVPDVLGIHHNGKVVFWGESGRMSADKAAGLAMRYPHTRIVHLRWGVEIEQMNEIEEAVLPSMLHRTQPFELIILSNIPQTFLSEDGTVDISRDTDLLWHRTVRFDTN